MLPLSLVRVSVTPHGLVERLDIPAVERSLSIALDDARLADDVGVPVIASARVAVTPDATRLQPE